MTVLQEVAPPSVEFATERRMLALICSAAFLVFVQTFMVAPLIPRLSTVFASPIGWVALAVPAYVVPQGIATLWGGPISDRFGRRGVILVSLLLFAVLTAVTASAERVGEFIVWRVVTGVSAAGIVPIGLTLIGDVVPFERRGQAVGWLFGAIAGGTATGAAAGALLEPLVGWQSLFLGVATLCALLAVAAVAGQALPLLPRPVAGSCRAVMRGYLNLLSQPRARRTYGYVMLNAILISGVFTWLGVYLHDRFGLDGVGIGLVLLGYGIPGLVFGPLIGRLADRYGRARIIPLGVALTGLCALLLALPLPLNGARVAIVLLSLGFDLTHPSLAAITTDLQGGRGQAVALMAFSLFTGFGLGSLLFQLAMVLGFAGALMLFGVVAWVAAAAAVFLFREERPRKTAGR
ncbi:MFS transporter [Castellaniella sp.]|uniref:MFS transporter n=1 Tax=Castellaniella sp. TaxID=1955812 RepID=UPI003A919297